MIHHFGQHPRDSHRELAIGAVEMRTFAFLAARRQPEHLRHIQRGRQFEGFRRDRLWLVEIGQLRLRIVAGDHTEDLHIAHAWLRAGAF